MTMRKGQFIFNKLRPRLLQAMVIDKEGKEHEFPYYNLHGVLFAISDEEFEEIEKEYRKYILAELHPPRPELDIGKKPDGEKWKN